MSDDLRELGERVYQGAVEDNRKRRERWEATEWAKATGAPHWSRVGADAGVCDWCSVAGLVVVFDYDDHHETVCLPCLRKGIACAESHPEAHPAKFT